MAFSRKQQAFIDCFDGDMGSSAGKAGYSGTKETLVKVGSRLLKNVEICRAIEARRAKEPQPLIMDRQALQTLWSQMAIDKNVKHADRLKATELLAKSQAMFLQKVELSGKVDTTQQVILYVPQNKRDDKLETDNGNN